MVVWTFTSIVHAFVCSRIDYCNSLLIGLPKVRLSPIQTVLNASARLIARLSSFSHISSFMTQQPHWLPFSTRIEFKVLLSFLSLNSVVHLNVFANCDHIRPSISASSLRRLRSVHRHDLFMPRVRTTLAHYRSFASISPSLSNHLPPLFARLFSLLPFPRLSLALSLTFFLELKALLFGFHSEKRYINIYMH